MIRLMYQLVLDARRKPIRMLLFFITNKRNQSKELHKQRILNFTGEILLLRAVRTTFDLVQCLLGQMKVQGIYSLILIKNYFLIAKL